MQQSAANPRPAVPVPAVPVHTAAHYRLLPEETTVAFTTRHLFGLAGVAGTVRVTEGRMAVDLEAQQLLLLEVELDMTSFASASKGRDKAVASPAFLDTVAHPTAVFRSSDAERTAAGWIAHGTLTVKGVAAPLDLLVDDLDPASAVDARATASIDRFDYGITIPTALAARRLQVTVTARAERLPAA